MSRWSEYLSIVKREVPARTSFLSHLKYFKYFPRWKYYLAMAAEPLNSRIPWINFPAIDFLSRFCNTTMHVFEYGSGGSTLFWADRVAKVISVEHDPAWKKQLQARIDNERLTGIELIHRPPVRDPDFADKDIAQPNDYISNNPDFRGYEFRDYVHAIEDFPSPSFDIVVVDGRARPSCVAIAKEKVKSSGILVVDNTERTYILQNCWPELRKEGWRRKDFFGPVPYLRHFCKTTILSKP